MIKNRKSFIEDGTFYKGNTHTHTKNSDGQAFYEDRIRDYKEHGYNFLVLTDHEFYSNYKDFDTKNFIMLPGIEVECIPNVNESVLGYHTVGIGLPGKILPDTGKISWPAGTKINNQLDWLFGNNNLTIAAHPNWLAMTPEALLPLFDRGVVGMEVFNSICHFGFGTGFSDGYLDYAVMHDRYPLIFASDDYHGPAFSEVKDHFTGYIMVKAPELTHKAIIDSILAGSFYASFCGPEIYNFEIKDGKAIVDCAPCFQISIKSPKTYGYSRVDHNSQMTHAEFNLSGREKAIHAVVSAADGKCSWTQILKVEQE